MRYHDPQPVLRALTAIAVLTLAAGASQGRSGSVVTHKLPPGGADRKPHNEQGRTAPDGTRKGGAVAVGEDYSLRMLAGGLGPVQSSIGSGRDGFDTKLYVVRQTDNSVFKLDPAGRKTPFTSLTSVAPQGACSWPAFDFGGAYGGSLYIQDPSIRTANVSPDGDASVFTINEAVDAVGTMAFDRAGAFAGALLLTDSINGLLYTVEPSGTTRLLASGTGAGRGLAASSSPILGDALYVGDPSANLILTIGPDHPEGEPAQVFTDLDIAAPGIRPVALEVSKYGPFGRGVLLVADSVSGRIVQLDASGQRIGEIGGGFRGIVSIEIAWTGEFTGQLIVTANGCIYTVTPKCRADWNADHGVTPSDLADFMTDFSAGDADFDGNGQTDNNDLTTYFAAYTAGCP